MSEETKRQVIEMSVGIVVHNLVIFLICLIWFRSLQNLLGVLIGMAAAILSLCSMAHSTELCVEAADEDYAKRKMTVHAICRSLSVFAVMALLWKFTEINSIIRRQLRSEKPIRSMRNTWKKSDLWRAIPSRDTSR